MPQTLPRVHVSDDHRFLVTETGAPFFWLGDTAWELFHRLRREEARQYFENRRARRFSVIQAVVLAELQGLTSPNAYGDLPLIDLDPTRPNEAYFRLVDEYIGLAAEHGLYVGLLPTWGDKVTPLWGAGPVVFDTQKARQYGLWLGERYREQTHVIWILGGDRPAVHRDAASGESTDFRPIWREMAAGIRQGVGAPLTMTYHPMGGFSTSAWLQDEAWLDVHMMQSGHGGGHDVPVWEWVRQDYNRTPTRPVLDGEPNYEDHPVSPWPRWNPANGYFRDYDVRKQCYRSVFAGACGVTYGHNAVWQFSGERYEMITFTDRSWREAIERPGAAQVQYLRTLMESRPYLTRIPDQSLLVEDGVAAAPAYGGAQRVATRDVDGGYALIYLPLPVPVTVNTAALSSGPTLNAWWYDPSSGEAHFQGHHPAGGMLSFSPPGHRPDWVLVLDDASRGYPPPGAA